ncbi:MAG: hypothetical protein AB1540_16420 [Bdellovibrionota bacterium]
MALLSEAIHEKEFDTRMVQRGLSKGQLLQDDLDKHLKRLTDDGENADYLNLETILEGIGGKSGLRD